MTRKTPKKTRQDGEEAALERRRKELVEYIEATTAKLLGTQHPQTALHLAGQLSAAIQHKQSEPDKLMDRLEIALNAIADFKPKDTSERLLIIQMVAVHESAMECFGRAMLPNQTFEGRDMNLKHAEKLTSIYAKQVEALDKHRGKGMQKITVEHVNVHAGGQAIVGDVNTGEGRSDDAGAIGSEDRHALSDESEASLDGEKLKRATAPRTRQAAQKKK